MNKEELNDILYKYQNYSLHNDGISQKTLSERLRSLGTFLDYQRDLRKLTLQKAIKFKDYLRDIEVEGKTLSLKRRKRILMHVQKFLLWLRLQKGYKLLIPQDLIGYYSLNNRELALAAISPRRDYPDLDYTLRLCRSIGGKTEIDRMHRAIVAILTLYGIRNSALRSLRLGAIDPYDLSIHQSPLEDVLTKNSTEINTFCMRINDELFNYFRDWVNECRSQGFSLHDPVFPRCETNFGEGNVIIHSVNLSRKFMRSKETLCRILRFRSKEACLRYYSPHQFRHCCVHYSLRSATNVLELKAVSQQFGHKDIIHVIRTYSILSVQQQKEIISKMRFDNPNNQFGI